MRFGFFTHIHPSALAPGKMFWDRGGTLGKTTHGAITRSHYQTANLPSLDALGDVLAATGHHQHLTQGIAQHSAAVATYGDALSGQYDHETGLPLILRSNGYLDWPQGPALMVLDSDSGGQMITMPEVWSAICEAQPSMAQFACLQTTSSSSRVRLGNIDTGIGGTHTYLHVANGRDIPRALDVLHKRLMLAGHARHKLGKDGSFLPRTFVDMALKVPSQPVYVRAHVVPPVWQDKGLIQSPGTQVIDTRTAIPDLDGFETPDVEKHLRDARAAMLPEGAKIRATYIEGRVVDLMERTGADETTATSAINSMLSDKVLVPGFAIRTKGGWVTVAEIMANPKAWHGQSCHDPIEPDYSGATVAKIFSYQARPYIHSFAHSAGNRGTLYLLLPIMPPISEVRASIDAAVKEWAGGGLTSNFAKGFLHGR